MGLSGKPKPSRPEDPQQAGRDEEEEDDEEEDPYAPLGVNDEEYDTILSSSNSVVIANRPPAPTPLGDHSLARLTLTARFRPESYQAPGQVIN